MADPISWINAGSQLLNAVGAAKASPGAPGVATSGNAPTFYNQDADFSGFTVATGRATANGAKISKTSSDQAGALSASALGDISPVMVALFVAGAVVLWKFTR